MTERSPRLTTAEVAALSKLGRIGALRRWSRVEDRTAATAPGRRAAEARFEQLVDPNGDLDAEERARRAQAARREHFRKMGRRSAQVRRRRGQQAPEGGDAV